ncbi:MAG TPA: hypothetical protein VFK36_08540 [Gemmatimonadales bacterium]|nr:hypothetical protein [Gemmatimonadales bacterium]
MVLGSMTAGMMLLARRGLFETRNRMSLTQARWALVWCESLARAQLEHDSTYPGASASLPNGAWCTSHIAPTNASFNINTADSLAFQRLLGADSLVAAVLDWRDADADPRSGGCERACATALGMPVPANRAFAQVAEFRQVRGWRSLSDSLLALLTVTGDGRINPAYAPAAVIGSLPGVSPALARRVELAGRAGRITGLGTVAQLATPMERTELERWWTDLTARTTFERGALIMSVVAGSRLGPAKASERLIILPSERGLAVLQREAW